MKKYYLIYSALVVVSAAIFFLFPINLFDGEIVFQVNGTEFIEKAKLSLSYFIGIGAGKKDLVDVVDFYLLPMGYFFAFLLILGLPLIITYRIKLSHLKKSKA